ncbi:MAG: hypothetical protein ACC628_00735 [Pirellulaceae bacterium]
MKVTDPSGQVVYHTGDLHEDGRVRDARFWFKADGFDRRGDLIDRHNLWDLVGASYKRVMYPGVSDRTDVPLQCPSMARGRVSNGGEKNRRGERVEEYEVPTEEIEPNAVLTVDAKLLYRKANPEFLDRVYGADRDVRSPVTIMTESTTQIRIRVDDVAASQ